MQRHARKLPASRVGASGSWTTGFCTGFSAGLSAQGAAGFRRPCLRRPCLPGLQLCLLRCFLSLQMCLNLLSDCLPFLPGVRMRVGGVLSGERGQPVCGAGGRLAAVAWTLAATGIRSTGFCTGLCTGLCTGFCTGFCTGLSAWSAAGFRRPCLPGLCLCLVRRLGSLQMCLNVLFD